MDNTKEDMQLPLFLSQDENCKPFFEFKEFDIAADKCVTLDELDELMERWTAPKGFFAKGCMPMGNTLPVVGLVYSFDEEKMYHCMPLPLLSRLLTTPEGHPDYAKKFADSFECFALEQMIGFAAAIVAIIFSLNSNFINLYREKGMFSFLLTLFIISTATLMLSFFMSMYTSLYNDCIINLILISTVGFSQALLIIFIMIILMIRASE